MKRQDRLALFLKSEAALLEKKLCPAPGDCLLLFERGSSVDWVPPPGVTFLMSRQARGADVWFEETAWPFKKGVFEWVVLRHPLWDQVSLSQFVEQLNHVLSECGRLLITARNQNTLSLLSALEEAGWLCTVTYFDFSRWKWLNALLKYIVPFAGKGFLIDARREVLTFTSLPQPSWECLKLEYET